MLKHLDVKKNKGFTIVEMLVVACVFSIVIGAAVGVFVAAVKLQKYNLSHQQLLNQTSYAMEYIDRMIRMAQKDDEFFDCITDNNNYENPDGDSSKIKFVNYRGECQEFYLDTGTNQLMSLNTAIDSNPIALTSDDFTVTSLSFNIVGESALDNLQPKVTIVMEIEGKILGYRPKIKLQTTVSQRNLDI